MLTLFRIDERLLHGQVLVGWGARLGIDHYVVVDEDLAESPWEQELYASGLPAGTEAMFLTPDEAARRFRELDARPGKGGVLTRGTSAMRRLAAAGLLEGRRVNIGGLHSAPGRRKVLDYVYLGAEQEADLEEIRSRAASVMARDLPTAPAVGLDELLGSRARD